MTKKEAIDLLTAHACCTYCRVENKLCNECPWHGKKECKEVRVTPELVQEAINIMQGATLMKMKLSDIKIPRIFTEHDPKIHKVIDCRKHWITYHTQDRYLILNKNGYLINGYIMYLVLKEQGVEEVEVKLINGKGIGKKKKKSKKVRVIQNSKYRNETTTYVYGVHPNSKDTKTYMWRVPKNWTNWADNIQIGDTIICSTKNGYAPVTINKIEILDKCPIDIPVKKVCNKKIRRNGIIVEI